jgi:hypothetical protein
MKRAIEPPTIKFPEDPSSQQYNRVPWKRVLYEKQIHYKDNYYDPKTIFSQLKIVKAKVHHEDHEKIHLKSVFQRTKIWFKSYSQYVFHSTMVMQQFSAICFFLCIHKYLLRKWISFVELASLNIFFIIIGTVLYYFYENPSKLEKFSLLGFFETILLFIICLEMTSPIIKTLTVSISDDTIEALTIFLAVIHLVFHDYQQVPDEKLHKTRDFSSPRPAYSPRAGAPPHNPSNISSSNYLDSPTNPSSSLLIIDEEQQSQQFSSRVVSLNTAIFTAILLASRLDNNNVVVAYIILAIISFSLFPLMVSLIKRKSSLLFLFLAVLQWLFTSRLICELDRTLFIAYELLVVCVWFLGPMLYLHMLSYKRAFHGPWNIPQIS